MRYARTPTSNNAQSNMQDAYRARGGEVGETVKDFGKKGAAETKQKTKMVNTKKIPCAKQGCKGKLTDNHGACGICGTKRLTPIICCGCEATITENVRCCTTCGTQIRFDPMDNPHNHNNSINPNIPNNPYNPNNSKSRKTSPVLRRADDNSEDVSTMTVLQLKELCGIRKLLKSRTRGQLQARLREHETQMLNGTVGLVPGPTNPNNSSNLNKLNNPNTPNSPNHPSNPNTPNPTDHKITRSRQSARSVIRMNLTFVPLAGIQPKCRICHRKLNRGEIIIQVHGPKKPVKFLVATRKIIECHFACNPQRNSKASYYISPFYEHFL